MTDTCASSASFQRGFDKQTQWHFVMLLIDVCKSTQFPCFMCYVLWGYFQFVGCMLCLINSRHTRLSTVMQGLSTLDKILSHITVTLPILVCCHAETLRTQFFSLLQLFTVFILTSPFENRVNLFAIIQVRIWKGNLYCGKIDKIDIQRKLGAHILILYYIILTTDICMYSWKITSLFFFITYMLTYFIVYL